MTDRWVGGRTDQRLTGLFHLLRGFVSNFYEQSRGKFTTNLSRVENGKDVGESLV